MQINKLDGLRGIACLVVILSHMSLIFFPQLHGASIEGVPTYPILDYIHNSPFCFFSLGHRQFTVFLL